MLTQPGRNAWVYKCNRDPGRYSAYGDWNEVFKSSTPREWGGSECTTNHVSRKILNKRIQKGDLVFAYQTNDRCIVGTCRVHAVKGPDDERILWLAPIEQFAEPVPIHELKKSMKRLKSVRAFNGTMPVGTLYEVNNEEQRILEDVCGLPHPSDTDEPALKAGDYLSAHGAGFGDPKNNRRVERAAIAAVKKWYLQKGWSVQSKEADRCGYDLECAFGDKRECAEVKGVSSSLPSFLITRGELDASERNPCFVIFVVTQALEKHPRIQRMTGRELKARYDFSPLQFMATLKRPSTSK